MEPELLLKPIVLLPLLIWSLFWKGWALWIAARRDERSWFVVILLLNTVGLLEIFYLLALGKRKQGRKGL